MQKNFTKLIAHFLSSKRYTVPTGAFLLFLATSLYVWAAVGVTVTGGSTFPISADLAADATVTAPGYTAVGTITIAEASSNDFASSGDIILRAPSGWRFKGSGVSAPVSLHDDTGNPSISTGAITFSADGSSITIKLNISNTNKKEKIEITGVEVQALNGSNIPGSGNITIDVANGAVVTGLPTTISNALSQKAGDARKVGFSTQPGGALINASLDPQPVVAILDQFDNTVTTATSQVSLAIGTNPPGNGLLNGTTTVNAVNGVANFSDLNIDKAGADYTLVASSGSITTATSSAFTVNNPQPTISSIAECLSAGDPETTVTITGENFVTGATVTFGGVSASSVIVDNSTTITAVIPEAAFTTSGNKNVIVTNPLPASSNGVSAAFVKAVVPLISRPIQGPSSICAGTANSNAFTIETGPNISSYLWAVESGDAEIVSGGTTGNPRINFGATPGEVVLSVVSYNVCGKPSPAVTRTITVNPLPTAELTAPNGTEACAGSTVALTATPVEGATFQWYRGTTAVTTAISDNTYNAAATGNYSVVVRYSGTTECAATSNTVGVTIKANPTATITKGATATYCADGSTTLTAQETGTGYTYQWYVGGSALGSETARTLTVSAEGDYTVQVTRNGCSTMSAATTVTELPLPTAEITPASDTEFCAGGSVTLNATTGTGYTYKWFAEGSKTVLDTDGSFTTSVPSNYYVEVTGSNGCIATSASVTVTVNQPPVATITATGPTDFCAGESVTLNAPLAPVGSTYSYEWNLNGSTTVIGTGRSFEAADPGTYTVTVINTTTGCRSTSAGTVVKEGSLDFAIFTYTGATEFCAPGSLQLDAILPPAGQNYTYRWFNAEGITVSQERSFSATVTGTYQVEITETLTEQNCVRTSVPIEVTVNPQPTAEITGGAQSLCAEADNTTTFSVSGTFAGGTAVWSSDNTNFVIEDAVYNTTTGVATATVVATGSGDATISLTTSSTVAGCNEAADAIVLNVKPLPTATITPRGETTFCQGGEVILDASQGQGYTYQWYLNGAPVIGTGSSYTASLSGNYYVVVTSNDCPVQSPAVAVTVNPLPTATIETAGDLVFCEGGSVTLNAVSDIGTSFTWFNGTTQVGTGQTFVADESGSYTVLVEAGTGCTNSSAAVEVTVNPTPDATITAIGATTFCERGSVTLQAPPAPSGQTYAYQWFNGDTQISVNGTSQTYQATASGNYTVRITNTSTALNCSATTATPVAVTVNPLPIASISYPDGAPTTFCQGGSLLLTGVSSTGPSSYVWYRNNIQVATGATYSAIESGSYTVRATDGNTCTGEMSAAVQVTVNPTITGNNIAGAQTVCSGGTIAPLTQASGASLAGGATPYAYQWQSSTNNNTWNNITTGGNAASYTPPVQTVTTSTTTYYRRIVSGGSCSSTSASVAVTVAPLPAKPTITNLAATYFSGDAPVTMGVSPASATGGSFTVKNAAGTTVSTSSSFAPCTLGAGTFTVTYTYANGTCSNTSDPVTVTINQSTYRVVVNANIYPNCRGDKVLYTATVYKDPEAVIYPYKADANGVPLDENDQPLGEQNLVIANPDYFALTGKPVPPPVIVANAFRYYQAEVIGGTPVPATNFTYQWTKNKEVFPGSDRVEFENAGLSSLDYYAVVVTPKAGAICGTLLSSVSNRSYSANRSNNYTIAISATPNPVCQGQPVTLTATLNSNYPYWDLMEDLTINWMVNRGGTRTLLETTVYNPETGDGLVIETAGPAGGFFADDDEIYIDFSSELSDPLYNGSGKCAGRVNTSQSIVLDVNDIATVAEPVDQSATVCLGGGATFTAPVTTTGPGVVNYVWAVGETTYPSSTSPSLTVGSDITAVAGVYPVSVVVSNVCGETTSALAVGDLTVRGDLAPFAVTGGGSYCAYAPENKTIGLSDSEIGVNYTLMRGTDVVETKPGTGEEIAFTAQTTPGTYTVEANYAAEPSCAKAMAGNATITATTDLEPTFGDLTVSWADDDMDQWIVEALEFSELYGANPTFRWYTRTTGQTDEQWVYTGASTTNTWVVDNPAMDLEIMVEVFTTDGTCQAFFLTNIDVTVLPVEIIYLNAAKQGYNVVLEWATAMEEDNKGFEVQVSTDGFNYRLLTFVPAKNGNSSTKQEYVFTDKENGKSGTRYYRLKQIDISGTYEFFGPKAVTFGSVASKVIAFPNPFHDEVTLDIAAEVDGEALITVTDAVGKQLLERKVQVQKGFTTEKLMLDANLPRGLYIIKAQVGGITQYIKMIKE